MDQRAPISNKQSTERDHERSDKSDFGDLTSLHPIGFQALTECLFIGSDLLTKRYVVSSALIVSTYCAVTAPQSSSVSGCVTGSRERVWERLLDQGKLREPAQGLIFIVPSLCLD